MLLKELLSIIGFNKLQQMCLIKILFLTGAIGFVPPTVDKLKDSTIVHVDKLLLSSNLSLHFSQNHPNDTIFLNTPELILDSVKFDSKEQAFNWLNDVMQRNFYKGKKSRLQVKDRYENNSELFDLLQNFNLNNEILNKGSYDIVLVPGCNDKCFKTRNDFLAHSIKQGFVNTSKIYIIGADRLGYPYREATVELLLAERLNNNSQAIEENLKNVQDVFIKVANEHLKSYHLKSENNIEDIRKIFNDNPTFYQMNKLTTALQKEAVLKSIPWPTEADIGKKLIPKELEKYNLQFVSTPNKIVDGKIVRGDTYGNAKLILGIIKKDFLKQNIKPKILIVSSQPFAWYQSNIFKSILSDTSIDVIAPKSQTTNISLLLSELSAIIYTSKYLIKTDRE